MQSLNIEISEEIVTFVEGCRIGLNVREPVPTLIYGKFDDEATNHFRVALTERSQFSQKAWVDGAIYSVPGLNLLYVQHAHRHIVENSIMSMELDCVVFEART